MDRRSSGTQTVRKISSSSFQITEAGVVDVETRHALSQLEMPPEQSFAAKQTFVRERI